ncbi:MAG: DNA cytosine methyltransferase [Gallionella sp.]
MKNVSAIDLFCGAGGLTSGFIKSGIKVTAGYDIESSCQYAYETNNNNVIFIHKDVTNVAANELIAQYPTSDIKLLAGCAPCQPFSTYSHGRDAKQHNKWPLLYQFSRLIREVKPELVTMENVPDVIKHEVYHDFVEELKAQNYHVWAEKVYCPDYGIPQMRSRHVLLASKLGPIKILAKTHASTKYNSVRQTIGNLPLLNSGEQHKSDPLHRSAQLSDLNLRRIRASKQGGTWRDWPSELVADCHRRKSGKTYSGVYARMSWDKPSPTMTTQCFGFGSGRFGHPDQDRAISLREAALLQTFPNTYKFIPHDEPLQMTVVGRMIGNAVPPRLGEVIGETFLQHLKEQYE